MTESDLQAIEQRWRAVCQSRYGRYATEWRAEQYETFWFVEYGPERDKADCYDLFEDPPREVCEFVAGCSTDIPALLAEVRRLQAEVADHDRLWSAADAEQDDLISKLNQARQQIAALQSKAESYEEQLVCIADHLGRDARHADDGTIAGLVIEKLNRLQAEVSRLTRTIEE